jgi:hypothetical protein
MNRTILAVALIAFATPALAQSAMTRAQLESFINATIKTNGVGAITGQVMNTQLNNLAASMATQSDLNTFVQAQNISGTPGITQSWSGASNLVTLNSNVTAASAALNEAAAIIRMTSSVGSGVSGEYKIALGTEMIVNPGSAFGHALNSVLTINSGVGSSSGGYSLETDCTNFNVDYPLPNQTGYLGIMANCQAIAGGSNTFPASAAIQVGTQSPTTFAFHAGLYFFGSTLLKDYTVYDGTSSTTSYFDQGSHSVGIELFGTYSTNAIQGNGFAINGAGIATFAEALSNNPSGGVGYATGAGGTVTQATSKSTGVTLNKVTGAITMNNAALAAGAIVSFTLTDTSIAATDTLILNHISGGTVGSYGLNAGAATGSATITVRNNSAGSLSEAIVIEFTVIKGVTS